MAITDETLRLTSELRIAIAATVDAETRRLVRAWVRAWDQIRGEADAAVADLLAIEPGRWPTRGRINRAERAQRLLAVARERLDEVAKRAGVDITNAAGQVVHMGSGGQPRIIASQMPPVAGPRILAARFDRVSPDALDVIVARTTTQIENTLDPLAPDAAEAMRQALVRGVAVGDNPREAARRMLRGLEGQFNGGLTRALTIARTEILDAHRAGSAAQHRANSDVLAGWVWHAQLDRRTCPSCWGRHGGQHPLSEDGPADHQQGRCTRTPVTRTWRELGFSMDEPPDVLPDARITFKGLPHADQLRIMGPGRLAGLEDGSITWDDLSQRRRTVGWRDSYGVRPLRDLVPA